MLEGADATVWTVVLWEELDQPGFFFACLLCRNASEVNELMKREEEMKREDI